MKKCLIIYPHFPPSNLAGVHRPRLFAQHLPAYGWEPVILTVEEKYYEETPDWNLVKLLPAGLRIEKVKALPITKPRLIGDIGLRAFFQLYKRAKKLIRAEKFDFLFIPIPSFYCALLGRMLHERTGIKYGIDYIDPWVHEFPGSERRFTRHWFSSKIARFLEPIAVKKAALITGVAEGYYNPVLLRNPQLKKKAITGAMPYGGEEKDHSLLRSLALKPWIFQKDQSLKLVYAGAMLPKAYAPLEAIFKSIRHHQQNFQGVQFHFIGTGKNTHDKEGFNIKPLAEMYGLWNTIVFEHPQRIPYLDVLIHLESADGIFILGSTEPHYTPSKTYQGVLSEKPLLAVLHQESSAVAVIRTAEAGVVLSFSGEEDISSIENKFADSFMQFRQFKHDFEPSKVKRDIFEMYSAENVTRILAELLDRAVANNLK